MSDEIRNDIATEQDEQQAPEQAETAQNESATSQPDDAPKKKGKKERKKLTPEQKKKRTIKALIITGSVLLAIIIFFSGCAIATSVGTNALIDLNSLRKIRRKAERAIGRSQKKTAEISRFCNSPTYISAAEVSLNKRTRGL